MNGDLKNLEDAVERDMALLRDLPPAQPPAVAVARVQAAVRRAAAQPARSRRLAWRYRAGLGVAAAAALAVAFWPRGSSLPTPAIPSADPELTVSEWTAAFEASDLRWSGLIDTAQPGEAGEDVDDLLRGLDQSLSDFEAL
jgi:hypothetical protein